MVEYGSGTTSSTIETSARAHVRAMIPLGVQDLHEIHHKRADQSAQTARTRLRADKLACVMAAGAHPRVDCPAGSMSFGRWSPASTDVESSSARLAGLASLCQKRASLFPRPNGPPPCEGHARKARSGRRGAQEFAHLAMASRVTQSWPKLIVRKNSQTIRRTFGGLFPTGTDPEFASPSLPARPGLSSGLVRPTTHSRS